MWRLWRLCDVIWCYDVMVHVVLWYDRTIRTFSSCFSVVLVNKAPWHELNCVFLWIMLYSRWFKNHEKPENLHSFSLVNGAKVSNIRPIALFNSWLWLQHNLQIKELQRIHTKYWGRMVWFIHSYKHKLPKLTSHIEISGNSNKVDIVCRR